MATGEDRDSTSHTNCKNHFFSFSANGVNGQNVAQKQQNRNDKMIIDVVRINTVTYDNSMILS